MAAYTIETWLKGKVDFDIPSATIMAILFDNGVEQGTPMQNTSEKQRDLCLADLLMWLSYPLRFIGYSITLLGLDRDRTCTEEH